jgi:23S rRNA (pseudouridine1915-N3)-methyltransferase
MKIKIITIGKPKGKFKDIFDEYIKRLSGFVKLEVLHIKENKNSNQKILKIIDKSFVILLDEKGKNLSSKELSLFLEEQENKSISEIVFLIGGTNGHDNLILERGDFKISFSKLTFPHDMAMIILAETLYRSFSILKNHPYHRE